MHLCSALSPHSSSISTSCLPLIHVLQILRAIHLPTVSFSACFCKNPTLEILIRPTQRNPSLSMTPIFFFFQSEEIVYLESGCLPGAYATGPTPYLVTLYLQELISHFHFSIPYPQSTQPAARVLLQLG